MNAAGAPTTTTATAKTGATVHGGRRTSGVWPTIEDPPLPHAVSEFGVEGNRSKEVSHNPHPPCSWSEWSVGGLHVARLTDHRAPVRRVVVAEDGAFFATGGDDGVVRACVCVRVCACVCVCVCVHACVRA